MDPVGFLIWTLEPGKPGTFEFRESPSRQLLEIDFPGLPDMDEIRRIAAQAGPDDAVRVRWICDEEFASSVNKQAIRDLFVGVDSLRLEPRILPVQRQIRGEGISHATTLTEKLKIWCKATASEDVYPRLAERVGLIQSIDIEKVIELKLRD
jgi:hypothetical protein